MSLSVVVVCEHRRIGNQRRGVYGISRSLLADYIYPHAPTFVAVPYQCDQIAHESVVVLCDCLEERGHGE